MRIFRTIFVFLLIFIFVLFAGKTVVLGAYEYTAAQIEANFDPATNSQIFAPNSGCLGCAGTLAGSYAPGQMYSGFYEWPPDSGSFYAIGLPEEPQYNGGGGGSGPEDNGTGACTGNYTNCWDWSICSPTCGPGTQERTCFDTGCGAPQAQSQACMVNDPTVFVSWGACSTSCGPGTRDWINQCGTVGGSGACMVNDPNVWGTPTTCSVKCGTGTQNITNQCGTTVPQACNTQACSSWIKLKDSSFISIHPLTDMLALAPVAYDSDDTTEQFLIVGTAGLAAAPVIDLDISNLTPTAKTGNPEYKVLYTPNSNSMTPALFLSYIKARKEYKVITDLGEITGSGIYVFNGDVSIDSGSSPFNTAGNIVLISTGTVTVDRVAPSTTFTPVGTAAIIAPTINFNSNLTEATGIFIGNTISTGTNAAQGLKIVGNLIAQTTLSNNREWPTTTRPSLFIKFDQTKYINLLP